LPAGLGGYSHGESGQDARPADAPPIVRAECGREGSRAGQERFNFVSSWRGRLRPEASHGNRRGGIRKAHCLEQWAALARRAESLCASQSRRPPGQEADPLAVCYDQLIAGLKDWDQGREAFARALAAGAYNLSSAERLLNEARDSHTADFTPLLASFVDAFPARPEADEIARLETVAEAWRRTEPALIRQALARCRAARAALTRRSGHTADAMSGPKEPASPLAAATPEEESSSKLKLNFNFDFDLGFGSGKDVEDPQLKGLPEIANLPLDAALALARSQTYAGARAAMLADILDTRSAELDSTRWAWLAEESLRESGAMRTSGDRLILLAELALWCYQHGEKALAATAAQSLATSFDALVQCGDASCAIFRNGGAPGTLIMLFAEYLRKNNIEPADLGLHPRLAIPLAAVRTRRAVRG